MNVIHESAEECQAVNTPWNATVAVMPVVAFTVPIERVWPFTKVKVEPATDEHVQTKAAAALRAAEQ